MIKPQTLAPGENPLAALHGDLFEIIADLSPGTAAAIKFDLRGVSVIYNVARQEISCLGSTAALPPVNGRIVLRLFVDRTALDIFAHDGRVYMPMGLALSPENQSLAIEAQGGDAEINSLTVYELKSAWE